PKQKAQKRGREGGGALPGAVIPPPRRGEGPRRSHPQEAKTPKQEVEDHRRGGDRAQKMRLSEPANNRGIGNAEKRRRQMRERHRQGEPGDAGVGDARRIRMGARICAPQYPTCGARMGHDVEKVTSYSTEARVYGSV